MPGTKAESPLSQMRLAAPCQQSWDTMSGNEHVRFCATCYKNVYKFSHLDRAQAVQLVTANEGRACVAYYRRADGSVMAEECPVGLRRVQRPFGYARAGLVALLLPILSFVSLLGVSKLAGVPTHEEDGGHGLVAQLRTKQPFTAIAAWLDPLPEIDYAAFGPSPLAQLPTLDPPSPTSRPHPAGMSTTFAFDLLPVAQVQVLRAPGYRMALRKPRAAAAPHPPAAPYAIAPTRQNAGHVAP